VSPETVGPRPPLAAPLLWLVQLYSSASGTSVPHGCGRAVVWVGFKDCVALHGSGATEPERRSAAVLTQEVLSVGSDRGWEALL
jgi:hypothetical protein